jgi:hypothetical protein
MAIGLVHLVAVIGQFFFARIPLVIEQEPFKGPGGRPLTTTLAINDQRPGSTTASGGRPFPRLFFQQSLVLTGHIFKKTPPLEGLSSQGLQ